MVFLNESIQTTRHHEIEVLVGHVGVDGDSREAPHVLVDHRAFGSGEWLSLEVLELQGCS